jgi:hypothetical protein
MLNIRENALRSFAKMCIEYCTEGMAYSICFCSRTALETSVEKKTFLYDFYRMFSTLFID